MTSRDPDTVRHVQPTTVRFTDEQSAQIRRVAKRQGVPKAQLVREATISWIAYLEGQGARDDLERRVARLEQQLLGLSPRSRSG